MYNYYNLYVPVPGSYAFERIKRGAAIVGTPEQGPPVHIPGADIPLPPVPERVVIDFEGDIYHSNMSFEEKVRRAISRHALRYPTVARMMVSPDDVQCIGETSYSTASAAVTIYVTEARLFELWCMTDDELATNDI